MNKELGNEVYTPNHQFLSAVMTKIFYCTILISRSYDINALNLDEFGNVLINNCYMMHTMK